jgi:hypothetical protein
MKIVLELEAADPEALLSSEALEAFITLARAGIEVTRVDPAMGITDPPIVCRMRDRLVGRSKRIHDALEAATREVDGDAGGGPVTPP